MENSFLLSAPGKTDFLIFNYLKIYSYFKILKIIDQLTTLSLTFGATFAEKLIGSSKRSPDILSDDRTRQG
jgi:hypothetical protein